MKKLTITLALISIFGLMSMNLSAQEENKDKLIGFDIGMDLMNRFIWRGINLGGSSPSIQPYASFTVQNFELGVFGAYSVGGNNVNQEFDLWAAYTFGQGMFTLMLTDYYSASDIIDYDYFDYNENTTGHMLEGALYFNGTENFPLGVLVSVMFYGADAQKINNSSGGPNFNTPEGIQYSNYFELSYEFMINDIALSPHIGISLNDAKDPDFDVGYIGESGLYANDPGIVNTGLTAVKEIQITDKFSLPLTLSISTNPQTRKVYFVCGLSL
jgi:hypothetical protein